MGVKKESFIHELDRKIFQSVGLEGTEDVSSEILLASCGVCGDDLLGPQTHCKVCESRYHKDCWDYNHGCAVYGCVGSQHTALATLETSVSARPNQDRAALLPPSQELEGWARLAATSPHYLRLTGLLVTLLIAQPYQSFLAPILTSVLPWFRDIPLVPTLVAGFLLALPYFLLLLLVMNAEGIIAFAAKKAGLLTRRPFIAIADGPTKALEAKLSIAPKDKKIHEALGLIYFARKNWESARDVYARLLKLDSQHPGALFRLAKIEEKFGNWVVAYELLQRLARQHHKAPFVKTARDHLKSDRYLKIAGHS